LRHSPEWQEIVASGTIGFAWLREEEIKAGEIEELAKVSWLVSCSERLLKAPSFSHVTMHIASASEFIVSNRFPYMSIIFSWLTSHEKPGTSLSR
jgi:hypothetical protein